MSSVNSSLAARLDLSTREKMLEDILKQLIWSCHMLSRWLWSPPGNVTYNFSWSFRVNFAVPSNLPKIWLLHLSDMSMIEQTERLNELSNISARLYHAEAANSFNSMLDKLLTVAKEKSPDFDITDVYSESYSAMWVSTFAHIHTIP